jgi:hypothetical protein
MSGSPKYSSSDLAEETARQLKEHLRLARAEEARRRAEAERQRIEQNLAEHAAVFRTKISELQNTFSSQLEALDEFVDHNALDAVKKSIAEMDARLEQVISNSSVLESASGECRTLSRNLERLVEEARSAQLKSNLDRVKEESDTLTGEFRALNRQLSFKHDRHGVENIESFLKSTRDKTASGDLQGASVALAHAIEAFGLHRDRIVKIETEIENRRDQVMAQVREAENLICALEGDPVICRWSSGELAAKRILLEQLSRDASTGSSSEASTGLSSLMDSIKGIEENAVETQLIEDKRNYIASSIQAVMEEFGFSMEAGFPRLQNQSDQSSEIVLLARRLSGERIAATIPHEGDVWYDVDGYRFEAGTSSAGSPTSSCDSAETQIEDFHKKLGSEYGVRMGKLRWDDQDPDRLLKEAKSLPREGGEPRSNVAK